MLTGRPPLEIDASGEAQLLARLERTPTAPSRVRRAVPRELDLISLMALERDPERRYQTAEALGVSLRTAQREWMRAKAWLREELRPGGGEGDSE